MSSHHIERKENSSSPSWDILGMGVVSVDDYLYTEYCHGFNRKTPIQSIQRANGGLVATALVSAAKLGASVAYLGVLGEDTLSNFAKQSLQELGVDCSLICIRSTARPIYAVIVVEQKTGNRTIFFSTQGYQVPDSEAIKNALAKKPKILLIDHSLGESGLYSLRLARQMGIQTIADFEEIKEDVQLKMLDMVDHLIINRNLGESLTGRSDPELILDALTVPGRISSTITDGANGCWFHEGNEPVIHTPALQVKPINTTGCGDVFHGAYAAAIANGESIPRAIKIATVSAGLKAAKPEGWLNLPDKAVVDSTLHEYTHPNR